MTPCKTTQESILDWLIGSQQEPLAAPAQAHLEGCACCRRYRDGLLHQGSELADLSQAVDITATAAQAKAQSACLALSQTLRRSESPFRSAARSPRFLRLAVAAVLLLLVGLIFVHSRVRFSSVSFARMQRAVNQVPWLHIVLKGDHPRYMDLREVWAGFDVGALAAKRTEGSIEFVDLQLGREYQYAPKQGYIQVEDVRLERFVYDLSSPLAFLQSVLHNFKAEGARLSHGSAQYQGRVVNVMTATYAYPHGTCQLELIIDPETHLLCAGKETWASPGRQERTTEIEVYYPDQGPMSIYDLGVPAMARVHGGKPFSFFIPKETQKGDQE